MAEWNFRQHHVQQYDNTEAASQIGSNAVLLSVGPPIPTEGAKAVVMGFVQNFTIQQQRQVMEIFEIGSERRYYLENPHRAVFQLTRALLSGPSLLKVVGSGMLNRGIKGQVTGLDESIFNGQGDIRAVAEKFDSNWWINLASSVLKNPFGLLVEFREFHGDGTSTSYGSTYLVNCHVQTHTVSMQSAQWLVQEDATMLFEYAIPLSGGSTVGNSYKKRLEIMNNVSNFNPAWFENYASWEGGPSK